MNEFAFMYVYVYMSLCFMLLDSVLINFICNCILIPKVRYESLIKNEQLKETKSIQDEKVQNRNRRQKNIHTSQRE